MQNWYRKQINGKTKYEFFLLKKTEDERILKKWKYFFGFLQAILWWQYNQKNFCIYNNLNRTIPHNANAKKLKQPEDRGPEVLWSIQAFIFLFAMPHPVKRKISKDSIVTFLL